VTVERCRPIELPVVEDPLGNLAFAEGKDHVPFPIARVFYVYGVPGGATRGGHAHRTLEEVVFCVGGRLEIAVGDGERRRSFVLDDPRRGLYLPPMVWYDIGGFAAGTVYLVLTSAPYDEDDYIRDHDRYLAELRAVAERQPT
jgi:dTDP-4-dehydrorhamnose 3,5-epimerase-like enzyme